MTGSSGQTGRPRTGDAGLHEPEAAETEALRRRLYGPGAAEADLRAYEGRTAESLPAPAPSAAGGGTPASAATPAQGRGRWIRRGGIVLVTVAGVALLVALVPTGRTPARTARAAALVPRAVLRPAAVQEVRRILSASGASRPTPDQQRRFGALVSSGFVESGAADALVVTGGGAGPTTARTGSLGVTAEGRRLEVVVATADHDTWQLDGVGRAGPTVVATAGPSNASAVTAAAIDVPPHVRVADLRIRAAAGEPVLYAFVLFG